MKKVVLLVLLTTFGSVAHSTIRQVPAIYPTIQSALSASLPYDTVLVDPGTYNENIIWPSVNGIRLIGSAGPAVTTISAAGSGRVMTISSSLIDTSTVIKGFTITGGYIGTGSGYGAGLYITSASVTLEDVVISGNRVNIPGGHAHGAGLHLTNSSSTIHNCVITGNSIDTATWCYGAGVYISGGNNRFTDVVISLNITRAENWCYGVGMYAVNAPALSIENTRIEQNASGNNAIWYYGTGIYFDDITASLTNVLVAYNRSGLGGSFNYGGGVYCDGTSQIAMNHVTVAGNFKANGGAINGSGIYARDAAVSLLNSISYNDNSGSETGTGGTGSISANYSDIRGGLAGTGNINALPQFISTTDYHLSPTSPCAGAGTASGSVSYDLDANPRPLPALTPPDMGCYEVDQSLTSLFGINDNPATLLLYPNPASTGELVHIKNDSGLPVEVTDTQGRLINPFALGHDNSSINTTGISSGIYLIRTGNRMGKLVIR